MVPSVPLLQYWGELGHMLPHHPRCRSPWVVPTTPHEQLVQLELVLYLEKTQHHTSCTRSLSQRCRYSRTTVRLLDPVFLDLLSQGFVMRGFTWHVRTNILEKGEKPPQIVVLSRYLSIACGDDDYDQVSVISSPCDSLSHACMCGQAAVGVLESCPAVTVWSSASNKAASPLGVKGSST